ncbi:hypothetical protein R3P38DRAFT_161769 [Favolaschia claudopus]|uniref:Uncharacterized protein n=1 Tax=Favolaschia claudopus TaxID=2862362 RepID=A0AAW0CZH9_9AGAR
MSDPHTVIVLGSSPESYFIGHGRRHYVENMSESFTNHAKDTLNVSMTTWASVSKDLETWVTYDVATDKFHFNGSIHQDIRDHLSGTNGKSLTDFVAFPDSDDPGCYFSNGKSQGAWNAFLDQKIIDKLNEVKAGIDDFDQGIKGMIFGKGKTFILMFHAGFVAELDDEEFTDEEHPLIKVLRDHSEGWCIERGSTLCFYDSKYFFLKFKKPGTSQTMMHWNLPIGMAEKLQDLQETAKQPEELMAIMESDQMWMKLAQSRMNMQLNMSTMMAQQMHRGGLAMLAAVTGGTVVEKPYYS